MGKVVVTEFISLDGIIEAPGGGEDYEHAGWSFTFNRGEEGDKFKFDELMASDAQLLGRVTYEGFAKAWPSMTEMGEFADKMNAMPKYVVSSTLAPADADWTNSTVISGDLPGEVMRLKEQQTGDILVAGSAQLVRSLAAHDLVDEYRLMVFPILLGTGKRLFGEEVPRTALRLVDSTPVGPDGVFILTYRPVLEDVEDRPSSDPLAGGVG
jgi:dihydrofolate reductase